MNSGNPLEDAIDYLNYLDKIRPNPDDMLECHCCQSNFERESGGMIVTGETECYCPECVKSNMHLATIRDYCNTPQLANFVITLLKTI